MEQHGNIHRNIGTKSRGYMVFSDLKAVTREPIMIMLAVMPVFLIMMIKIMIPILTDLLHQYLDFDLSIYYVFILAGILMITPDMLGAVSGFLMLDERDGHIAELMMVTPMGLYGYLIRRLKLPFIGSLLYTAFVYFVVDLYTLQIHILLAVALFAGIQGICISLILASLADNKVKGLTIAKGLNLLILPAFSELFNVAWFQILAFGTPFYWTMRIIQNREPFIINLVLGVCVNLVWVLSFLRIWLKKER